MHAQQLLEQLQLRDTQMEAKQEEIASLKETIAESNLTLSTERAKRADVERELSSVNGERDRLEAEINVISKDALWNR